MIEMVLSAFVFNIIWDCFAFINIYTTYGCYIKGSENAQIRNLNYSNLKKAWLCINDDVLFFDKNYYESDVTFIFFQVSVYKSLKTGMKYEVESRNGFLNEMFYIYQINDVQPSRLSVEMFRSFDIHWH